MPNLDSDTHIKNKSKQTKQKQTAWKESVPHSRVTGVVSLCKSCTGTVSSKVPGFQSNGMGRRVEVAKNENSRMRTGEMAQQLRALAALAEDLGSVPSKHMVAHNCL